MTAVENIALIVIAFIVIKLIVLLVNPKRWMNFSKKLYSNKTTYTIVSLILAAVVLYYLLLEITIVQILAVVAFVALLMMIGLGPYYNSLAKIAETQIKKGNFWKDNWFYILIWGALIVWALVEMFA